MLRLHEEWRERLTWWVLILGTLLLYWPIRHFDFVNYDDPVFVTLNPRVTPGLTWAGVQWAFTTSYADYWRPLSWLSHMLDCQWFGLQPGPHHLVSVGWHILNSVLLFVALRRLTGSQGRSALVAALFAWHPLHVESVAWIAERKDVLSGTFWMLALLAYARYARSRATLDYALALLAFAFGLMTKPMVVTLPCVLLLLDFWPLRRFDATSVGEPASPSSRRSRPGVFARPWAGLVWEKVPFLLLAVASSVITYLGQRRMDAVISLQALGPTGRLANALAGYLHYLGKTFWPLDLAVFYPGPREWPAWELALATALLFGVTLMTVRLRRRRPHLLVGWLWFLGTLVPVVGLIQAGDQAMADRYTYLPLIGLFIMAAWSLPDGWVKAPVGRAMTGAVAAVVLLACAWLTTLQLRYWQNTETLFEHALAVTTDSALARTVVGSVRAAQGRDAEAEALFAEALRLNPDHSDAHVQWGALLERQNRRDAAIEHYRAAVRAKPTFEEAHLALGLALHQQGNLDEAIREFRRVLELNPDSAAGHNDLAMVLYSRNEKSEAIEQLRLAVKIDPRLTAAQLNLARALQATGQTNEAEAHFRAAAVQGRAAAAARLRSAAALVRQHRGPEARDQLREAVRVQPDSPALLNDVAWILSTAPDADARDGAEAVRLAGRACELTRNQEAILVGTLAAAYAEAGRFEDAIATAQKAHDLAVAAGHAELAETNLKLLELYRAKQPFREGPATNLPPGP